jgi:flagellin-specific chaperone FliS
VGGNQKGMNDEIDYRHMRRAESEIIRAQMVILRALQQLMPYGAGTDIAQEIESKLEDLYDFHYDGKYRDDTDDDGIVYRDSE